MALLALESVKDWTELDGKTEKEREEKFIEALRGIKKPFTVETKKYRKGQHVDLDAGSALELFKIAGVNIEKVNNAKSGSYIEGSINLDTGNEEGLVVKYKGQENGEPYTGQPLTVFFDHHALESKRGTSATKFVYETLRNMNLLEQDSALEKAVEFVNHEDNRSYPNEERYYKDSPNTLLGLGRFIEFKNLYQFFKDGLSPTQKLTPEQLAKYGLTKAHEDQEKIVANTEPMFKELEKNGFLINSKKYGKILVDIGSKFNKQAGGFVGAKAMGADSYVQWNAGTGSFMFSTKNSSFEPGFFSQGRPMREAMWIKDDKLPLKIRLYEVLSKMTGNPAYRLPGNIERAIKQEVEDTRSRRLANKAAQAA